MSGDNDNELSNKVIDWLANQGYPLEMEVARAFLKAGFRTVQAEYYEDPETKTPREIDVVAHDQDEIAGCLVRLRVCIECKVSKGKPWVLLTSKGISLADPARVAQRAASALGRKFLISVAQDKTYQSLRLFQLPPRPAYGLMQAFTTGNDLAYAACMSAAKAAAATTAEADIANKTQGPILEVVVPAIVIDGRLFESFINENGEMVVNEVSEGTLVWRNSLVRAPHTIIRVVTIPYLPQFIREVQDAADLFLKSENEIEQFLVDYDVPRRKGLN
jgi:hypothetical protein